LETRFREQLVTRQAILFAMQEFDRQYANPNDYENWLERESYVYCVWHDSRQYPPKHILSVVTGISTTEFSGGDQTNRVFADLGFEVTPK
jgi:hypothetical protein